MNDKNSQPAGPEDSPLSGKIDYDEIRKLVSFLEEKNLSVFELEVNGLKVKIGRNVPPAAGQAVVQVPPGPASSPEIAGAVEPQVPAVEAAKERRLITSPMVGTFYRAPDPASAPFVDIGDPVQKGQTLCIIEAMKLMNEIEADVGGTIVEIFAKNAEPVEFGQKLFAILPVS